MREGTAAELEAARVADGWPAMGVEIEPGETIPAETGVVAVAVDFRKGCYPGQELVERMDSRGATAPRSLRVARRRRRARGPVIRSSTTASRSACSRRSPTASASATSSAASTSAGVPTH